MKELSVWKISVLAFGVFSCVAMVSAKATTLGDPEAGRQYAQSQCASCHSIDAGSNASPVDEATPFQAIADTDGMTRTALVVFFRSPPLCLQSYAYSLLNHGTLSRTFAEIENRSDHNERERLY